MVGKTIEQTLLKNATNKHLFLIVSARRERQSVKSRIPTANTDSFIVVEMIDLERATKVKVELLPKALKNFVNSLKVVE